MWTNQEAQELVQNTHCRLSGLGFTLAVFGSVIREGNGADLDLALIQLTARQHPYVVGAVQVVTDALGALAVRYHQSCANRLSLVMVTDKGRVDLILLTILEIGDQLNSIIRRGEVFEALAGQPPVFHSRER